MTNEKYLTVATGLSNIFLLSPLTLTVCCRELKEFSCVDKIQSPGEVPPDHSHPH